MNRLKILVSVFALCLLVYGVSWAEEASDILKEIKVNGFVSTAYNNNLNDPDSRMVNYRPFNQNAGSFNVDVAELVFQKDATEESNIGFRTDIMYGYTVPKAIRSTWPGVTQSADDDFDVQQAYVRYIAPVGSGLTLDMGKFITEMGAEVIEGYDAWNYNYSRSLLFYYTIPFTHTGLRATYKVNDTVTVMGQVLNGWDNVVDNNKSKSYCAHLMLMPVANTMLNLKYMTGPEQTNNDSNNRGILNVNLTTTLMDNLTLNFDFVNGSEQKDPANLVTPNGDSKWSGIAGIIRYVASDRYAINIRAETFSDSDGARTGVKQEMTEITITPEFTIKKNMVIRPEFRHDVSDQKVFDKGSNAASEKTQDTIAINMFFYF